MFDPFSAAEMLALAGGGAADIAAVAIQPVAARMAASLGKTAQIPTQVDGVDWNTDRNEGLIYLSNPANPEEDYVDVALYL